MNYADLAVMQASRSKTFSAAQTDAMAAYCQAEHDLKELQAENAKLRELAERAWKTAGRLCQAFDGPCSANDLTSYKPCPMGERDEECVYGQLQVELREMGIEVDG